MSSNKTFLESQKYPIPLNLYIHFQCLHIGCDFISTIKNMLCPQITKQQKFPKKNFHKKFFFWKYAPFGPAVSLHNFTYWQSLYSRPYSQRFGYRPIILLSRVWRKEKWTEPWVPHCSQVTLQARDLRTCSGHSCSEQLCVRLTHLAHLDMLSGTGHFLRCYRNDSTASFPSQ